MKGGAQEMIYYDEDWMDADYIMIEAVREEV